MIRFRLYSELHYFSIFTENDENDSTSTLSSGNFTDGNFLLKERTHTCSGMKLVTVCPM